MASSTTDDRRVYEPVKGSWVRMHDNMLVCENHVHDLWCACRTEVLRAGLDGNWTYEAGPLRVPIMPKLDVFADVYRDEYETAGGRKMFAPLRGGRNEFVGFLSPGEGMNSIRSVLVEWSFSQVRDPSEKEALGSECEAASHNIRAQSILIRNYDNPKTGMYAADTWLIATQRICYECYRQSADSGNWSGENL